MGILRCFGCMALRRLSSGQSFKSIPYSHIALQPYNSHSFRIGRKWMSSLSWIPPDGYDTGVMLYNSICKSTVPLKTIHPGLISWYSCGPTVYDSAHLGHALCYVRFDIIRRVLARVFNINVVMIMGVTDIDDKIIKQANKLKTDFREVAKHYEEEFFADMDRLGVLRPSLAPRVTDHIPIIIDFIQKILDNNLAYEGSDGSVYFDTDAYGRYGKMVPPSSLPTGKGVIKKSVKDFALWKNAKPDEPFWESPWGPGRPGWHIECSAMANHILGTRLDLHSGGIDLLFPHHENEEAQCCAHNGDLQWCNYWMHAGHLHAKDAAKMSKSLRNTISVTELLEDHSVNSFRLYCLLRHYRSRVDYVETSLHEADALHRRMRSFLHDAHAYINGQLKCGPLDEVGLKQKLAETRVKVKNYLADDMDTPRALTAVFDLITKVISELHTKPTSVSLSRSTGTVVAICSYIHYLMEDVFGMSFSGMRNAANMSLESSGRLNHVMNSVLSFRHDVRSYALLQNDPSAEELSNPEKKLRKKERIPLLQACDNLRENLKGNGIHIKDHADSSTWSFSDSAIDTTTSKRVKKDEKV